MLRSEDSRRWSTFRSLQEEKAWKRNEGVSNSDISNIATPSGTQMSYCKKNTNTPEIQQKRGTRKKLAPKFGMIYSLWSIPVRFCPSMHPPPAQRAGKGHSTSHPDTDPPDSSSIQFNPVRNHWSSFSLTDLPFETLLQFLMYNLHTYSCNCLL